MKKFEDRMASVGLPWARRQVESAVALWESHGHLGLAFALTQGLSEKPKEAVFFHTTQPYSDTKSSSGRGQIAALMLEDRAYALGNARTAALYECVHSEYFAPSKLVSVLPTKLPWDPLKEHRELKVS